MTASTETFEIRLSSRYALDHLDTSTIPGTHVSSNGRGELMRFTLGELHELWSRADHYADPYYGRELRESGYADLHRSAIKVIEQLDRAGLIETATSDAAKQAYSIEYRAEMQRRDVELAEIRELVRNTF